MDMITSSSLQIGCSPGFYCSSTSRKWKNDMFYKLVHHFPKISFPFKPYNYHYMLKQSYVCSLKKENSDFEALLDPSIVKEVPADDNEDFSDDLEDEELDGDGDGDGDDFLEDEYLEVEPVVGDGCGGGGVSLAGTSWDKSALGIAEEVARSFDGELGIYAFKTLLNGSIQVRVEKLTNKSGSPTLMDVEAFSSVLRQRLDEAAVAGDIPDDFSLEVSSPGVERLVRIPQDLERFKDRAMLVKYICKVPERDSESERDGVFRLVSFSLETCSCTWGTADVRVNREKAGKGRPLNKKQREWRLETPFDSLRLVRLYSEI